MKRTVLAIPHILINAVQEQQKTIDRQEARIAKLEHGPVRAISSLVTGGLGGVGLCFVPLGLVFARRLRRA